MKAHRCTAQGARGKHPAVWTDADGWPAGPALNQTSTPALTPGSHGLLQATILVLLIFAGIAIYGLFLRLFGITGWREAVNAIRQNQASDLRD